MGEVSGELRAISGMKKMERREKARKWIAFSF